MAGPPGDLGERTDCSNCGPVRRTSWGICDLVAIVPHDNSEANDEVIVSLQGDGSQLSLFRDQVSVAPAMVNVGTRG